MGIARFITKLAFPLAICAFGGLLLLERRRPLRGKVESKGVRTSRNFVIAAAAFAAMQLIERPVAEQSAIIAERHNIGLLRLISLPKWLEKLAAIILLDYSLYLWHVLTHRVPFLWRFHVVHHVDLDLDASTAVRFHFGEIILSTAWRAAQVVVIGVSPEFLRLWQAILLPSVLFHHSNIDLPKRLESILSKFLVTPRLHGIHHSIVQCETDSNWSSGLSVWDRLHGTFRDRSAGDEVNVGVPAYRRPSDVTVGKLLELPFHKQPSAWERPPYTDDRQ